MMSQVVQEAINEQIHAELSASYSYLAMSAYCDHHNFTGAAKWLRVQSQEEYAHAMKLYDFLLARHARVALAAPKAPRNDFGSIVEVFEAAYAQEQDVTASINRIYELAFKERSFDAVVMLEWFVNEQVEEEKTAREIVARLNMVKDDPASLLDIDRDLGSRTPGEAGTEGGE